MVISRKFNSLSWCSGIKRTSGDIGMNRQAVSRNSCLELNMLYAEWKKAKLITALPWWEGENCHQNIWQSFQTPSPPPSQGQRKCWGQLVIGCNVFFLNGLLYGQVYEVVGRDVDEDIFPDVWRQGTKPVDPQALFVCLKPSFSEQTHKIWIFLPWATSSCCWAGSHCCRTRRQGSHHPTGLNLK